MRIRMLQNQIGTLLIQLVLVVSVWFIAPTALAASAPLASAFEIHANTNAPSQGARFTVSLSAAVSELYAFETIVSFDPQKLRFLQASSSIQGFLIQPVVNDNKAILALTKVGNVEPMQGDLELVNFTFEALAQGETEVIWESLKVANRDLTEVKEYPEVALPLHVQATLVDTGQNNGSTHPVSEDRSSQETATSEAAKVIADAHLIGLSDQAVSVIAEQGNGVHVVVHAEQAMKEIKAASAETSSFFIQVPGNKLAAVSVDVPSDVLRAIQNKSGAEASLIISSSTGTYKLPIQPLNLEAGSTVTVSMTVVSQEQTQSISKLAIQEGFTLVSVPVDFSVSIKQTSGETSLVKDYERVFATRVLPAVTIDPSSSGAVMLDSDDKLVPVPVLFVKQLDSTYLAVIQRMGNSTYGFITGHRTFQDLKNHWSRSDIEALASRMLVNGDADGQFHPNAWITRAEFAKLLTDAFALPEKASHSVFNDVDPFAWYASALDKAIHFGLMEGDGQGNLRPEAYVSREEIAVMLDRARSLTAFKYESPSVLLSYADSNLASEWSKEALGSLAHLGIIQGDNGNHVRPTNLSTRSEAAVMVKRLLIQLGFMN